MGELILKEIATISLLTRDSTGTVSGTVPARNNVGSVWSQNIFCSRGGTC